MLRMVDLIQRKRDGLELTTEEVNWLVHGYSVGEIPDYQMSAWTMTVFYRGMSARETADLTLAMASSGDQIDLTRIHGTVVDKHSTGGVGDTTTLILAPLVSAVHVPVAKMSGRGLGHTGGTIDKLESIHGLTTELTNDQFIDQVNRIGIAVAGQSGNLTPADKKLYALRDVTATVDSIPLIASSIMSKKIAAGADAIVLDVKVGHGAFMKSMPEAIQLAQAMVDIGALVGRETIAVVSAMDQPLGYAVGNALELKEAIDTLQGRGPKDLEELCLKLGSYMMILGGRAEDEQTARLQLKHALEHGQAWEKFRQFITAQGGLIEQMDRPDSLVRASHMMEVRATESGFVQKLGADGIGLGAMMLGAGRETKDTIIDLDAGVVLHKKIGDAVKPGDSLATLYHNKHDDEVRPVIKLVKEAYTLGRDEPTLERLIRAIVTKDGIQQDM